MPETARSMNGRTKPPAALSERLRVLELDVERDRGTQSAHERLCSERYAGIEKSFTEVKDIMHEISAALKGVTDKQAIAAGIARGALEARKPKWWVAPAATLAAVFAAALMGLIGWMGGRLVTDQDQRIQDAKRRPAAVSTVTVNPAEPAVP